MLVNAYKRTPNQKWLPYPPTQSYKKFDALFGSDHALRLRGLPVLLTP